MPASDPNTMPKQDAQDAHTAYHLHRAQLTSQMRGVLERMARAGRAPLHRLTPQAARAAYAAGAEVLEVPRAPLPRVQDLHIPARDGFTLPARLYAPSTRAEASALPLLLYLHGGGFTIGSIATHDILCRELARLAPCMVVSLDYRLAPEHPFPTATHDAWDALAWLAQHAHALGADPARLAVGGDSAGGTLAAVNALLARDAGLPLALQLLIYPGCTAHQDTPSHRRYAQGLVLEAPAIEWFFGHYVRNPAQRTDWRFAPLLAPDVEGVAPAWIGLAECDPLVDEGLEPISAGNMPRAMALRDAWLGAGGDVERCSTSHLQHRQGRARPWPFGLRSGAASAALQRLSRHAAWTARCALHPSAPDRNARHVPCRNRLLNYADKLRAAGVPVELEIYRGVTHEFIKMGRVLPEARQAHADAARALRRAFELPSEEP